MAVVQTVYHQVGSFRRRICRRAKNKMHAFDKYIPVARVILLILWFFIYFEIDPRYFIQENEDEELYRRRRRLLRQHLPQTVVYSVMHAD
jgi:hypothetical protein